MTFKWDVKLLFQSHFKHDLISTLPNIAGSNDSPGEQGMLGLISRLALGGWSSRSCRAEPLMMVRRTPALSCWRFTSGKRGKCVLFTTKQHNWHVCLWKQKNVCSASHRTLQSKRENHLITYTHGKLNTSCFSFRVCLVRRRVKNVIYQKHLNFRAETHLCREDRALTCRCTRELKECEGLRYL